MRSILIPVADRPECALALDTAFDLADHLSANITGLHIRPHRQESKAQKKRAQFGWSRLADFYVALNDEGDSLTDEDVSLKSRAAEKLFHALCDVHDMQVRSGFSLKGEGGQAVWKSVAGGIEPTLSLFGPLADLIVVSRPRGTSSARGRAFMMASLLCSGRPVLILPHSRRTSPGKRVLIAWNQSHEAASVVHTAIPLIRAADSVHIFVAGKERSVGPKATALQQYLKQWNVPSQVHRTQGNDVDREMLETYRSNDCDLVIMGAYSRAHWREMIFGGVTDFMLHKTSVPVLLMHR